MKHAFTNQVLGTPFPKRSQESPDGRTALYVVRPDDKVLYLSTFVALVPNPRLHQTEVLQMRPSLGPIENLAIMEAADKEYFILKRRGSTMLLQYFDEQRLAWIEGSAF